jgi:tartrate dehydratase beta subunit/fumarate hydratase class I family protein
MAALKTVRLKLPATIDDLRKLEIGTVAYLTGRIFTAREGVYKHAIEDGAGMPASKEALGLVNFHCSPAARINPDGTYSVGAIASAPMEDPEDVPLHALANAEPGYTVGAVSATASFRFVKWLDRWFKLSGCNIIIGKGGMTSEVYRSVFVPNEVIYLTTVGYGTGALLGRGIKGVGSMSSASPRRCGCLTWKTSGRSWSRATLRATACSSARTRRSRRASKSSTSARARRRCAATARPTIRPKR